MHTPINSKKRSNLTDEMIQEVILSVIKKKNPETVESLVEFIRADYLVSEDVVLKNIQILEIQQKVDFNLKLRPVTFSEYLFSSNVYWFWCVIFIIILAHLVLWTNVNIFSFLILRNFVGLAVVLYLPGYSLCKTMYPVKVPFNVQSSILEKIERVALSLCLSITIVPIIGLTLYGFPSGLDIFPLSETILVFTLFFSILAIWREYIIRRATFLRRVRKNLAFYNA
jgi:hypothetical protein